MNGVHDMGGMHGFGPVERDDAPYHAGWEVRVRAIMGLTTGQGIYNLDEFRYGIERMPPAEYLRSTYFERWLATVEYNLIQKGVISTEELENRVALLRDQPDAEFPRPADLPSSAARRAITEEPMPSLTPRFAVGDAVVTRNAHPTGHTRIPRYVRGKRGTIHLVHGPEIFPDTNAHGRGENPQVVYSVRFDGRELWGESAEPHQSLNIDLWESYLEPARV